jgi:transcriptional regulator with XRE-family HTH domain
MATTHTRLLQQIGLRIRELRAECGMTQEALADKSKLFRTYIGRIESGHAGQFSIVAAFQIAKAFKVPIAAIFEPPKSTPPKRVSPQKKFSRGRVTK